MRHFRGRYKEERPLVRGRDESFAVKTDKDGKKEGSRAAAGLWVWGAQAMR